MSKILKANVDMWDIEELACKITGLDYDEIDADTHKIEEKLYEDVGIGLEEFRDIVNRLLPLISAEKSPITNKMYKGFADVENNAWLTKIEI